MFSRPAGKGGVYSYLIDFHRLVHLLLFPRRDLQQKQEAGQQRQSFVASVQSCSHDAELRQVRQLLDLDDGVVQGGLQALGHHVGQDYCHHHGQDVGDLTCQLKADHCRGYRVSDSPGRLTNDCVPSWDDAVKDAIEHNPMRKQRGHDLSHQPAECSSYRTREK
ncbi:hypothetical protein F7725_025366 [Dissostichus mawsoni]|uniref:Uncharacterized protein n=1 Tax=Dissostichus mawsoni TaxID=36200 RepID=A0A7J5XAY6_DISMA|nr:hypothetical protein F7725_025366 [Dissostichus mawsoni]